MATQLQQTPLDVLLSVIPSLPRPLLARLTARLIDRMDEIDPDPDVEANGDEQDGTYAEDDFGTHGADIGAGCPISDPGGGDVLDEGEPGLNPPEWPQ